MNCDNAVFNSTSFSNLELKFLPFYQMSLRYDNATCNSGNMPVITISGSGQGFGTLYEVDPDNRFNWTAGGHPTCVWTGAISTDWLDPGNWSSCNNGRGNYPNQTDFVSIPSAPTNQPVVDSSVFIGRISGGDGTITVNAGKKLFVSNYHSTLVGNITLQGSVANCTTCNVYFWGEDPRILGTLSLGSGITVNINSFYGMTFGYFYADNGTGHLRTVHSSSDPAEWPRIRSMIPGTLGARLLFRGASTASRSSIDVDGLWLLDAFERGGFTGISLSLYRNWSVLRLDNVIVNSSDTSNSLTEESVGVLSCDTGSMADKSWEGIDFVDGYSGAGKNIYTDCTSLPGGGSLELYPLTGGTNAGYGAIYATDPNGLINWN